MNKAALVQRLVYNALGNRVIRLDLLPGYVSKIYNKKGEVVCYLSIQEDGQIMIFTNNGNCVWAYELMNPSTNPPERLIELMEVQELLMTERDIDDHINKRRKELGELE